MGKSFSGNRTNEFAGFCYDEGREPTETEVERVKDEFPSFSDEDVSKRLDFLRESKFALRYCEFIAPMIKAIQELSKKVEHLEKNNNS